MKLRLKQAELVEQSTPVLAVCLAPDYRRHSSFRRLDEATGGSLGKHLKAENFKGNGGQLALMTGLEGLQAERLLVLGLGKSRNPAAAWRTAAARASRWARGKGLRRMAFLASASALNEQGPDYLAWLAEGLLGGIYGFDGLKGDKNKLRPEPSSCNLFLDRSAPESPARIGSDLRRQLEAGRSRADAINWVRDLVNQPPNLMGPRQLESRAREMAEERGIYVRVFGDKAIGNRGMGLLASVAAGTSEGARLLHLRYRPQGQSRGSVALVGKGVTFDSGGLSLKAPSSQPDMKSDMAGAATALGILRAAADEGIPWEIHAIVPICENMPGPGATRPGDVYKGMSGKSVEVRNTDAEGRLILADALSYAAELEPDLCVDFATLTGACMVALGRFTAGLFGNRQAWVDRTQAAAQQAGELMWPLPLEPALKKELKSDVADLRNTGSRWGGAITAALFLSEFAGDMPWLHLDIAGPAFLDRTEGYSPKGATGFGVLSLLELLRSEEADAKG